MSSGGSSCGFFTPLPSPMGEDREGYFTARTSPTFMPSPPRSPTRRNRSELNLADMADFSVRRPTTTLGGEQSAQADERPSGPRNLMTERYPKFEETLRFYELLGSVPEPTKHTNAAFYANHFQRRNHVRWSDPLVTQTSSTDVSLLLHHQTHHIQ